jgi:glycosyltransferase involved in cell wall biosynthesis
MATGGEPLSAPISKFPFGLYRSGMREPFAVVLPFFNEERFLEPTLASLAAQARRPDRLVLVDNASTDASTEIARAFAAAHPALNVEVKRAAQPGKASALALGLQDVREGLVATCDADTFYPPHYLARAEAIFARDGAVAAALAFGVHSADPQRTRALRAKGAVMAALAPRQTHGGGYGQTFRAAALHRAGGFSPERWPYCLMDHEIMHRIVRDGGRLCYDIDHWCVPSPRRSDRKRVRWTLGERLFYHVVPLSRRDWFFYEYLRPRFERRKLGELALRDQPWNRISQG